MQRAGSQGLPDEDEVLNELYYRSQAIAVPTELQTALFYTMRGI